MTKTETAVVEVLLENGTIATKRVTANRNYTHAVVTDTEVISWHTGQVAALRSFSRPGSHVVGSRIVRTRMAS